MKQSLLVILLCALSSLGFAQYPTVTVHDIQFVSPSDLLNCNDTSSYFGDTVVVTGVVITDGNIVELASGSTDGGYRPEVYIIDTANNGVFDPFSAVAIHGVYPNPNQGGAANLPVSALNNLIAGTEITVTGVVNRFSGQTQVAPINNSAVVSSSIGNPPAAIVTDLGQLNDDQRVNILETGEQWENAFVELQNVTVTNVTPFSGGSRISFDVTDQNGNVINVSDRFLVQKLPSHQTVNPASPQTTGSFVAPPVGTNYTSLSGIILHSENGCTGQTGRGYELNPFDASHYNIGVSPPTISNVMRDPVLPSSSDDVTVTATITDFDGTVSSTSVYWTDDPNTTFSNFTQVNMTLVGGSTDEYEADIPAAADGTLIRYYVSATDNDNNTTVSPFTPSSQTQENVLFYTVRDNGLTIRDVQENINPGGGDSPYAGEEVTVTGVVTASTKNYDLGYVHIQDPNETEWAGIFVTGNPDLTTLFRGDEVEITGFVSENFGLTVINATDVSYTGNTRIDITPVSLDPSDNVKDWERYEGMLVQYTNAGSKVFISDPEVNNFADYLISTDAANDEDNSTYVQAGRQDNSNFSSLWVSLVSNAQWETTDGDMNVPVVLTTDGTEMDTLRGIMYFGFGNWKVLPRNNADIIGLNVALDMPPADAALRPVGINEFEAAQANVRIFPNPANEQVFIGHDLNGEVLEVSLIDITGRVVMQEQFNAARTTLTTSQLEQGIYVVRIADTNGNLLKATKLIINH